MDSNLVLEQPDLGIRDGKHLVFLLKGNSYGIPILEVSEINGIMDITPIPKSPEYIKGIINLRGKIIPVMDLRLKLGMNEKEYDVETCIVIVNTLVDNVIKQVGIVVDTVSEVFDIPLSEIDPPPTFGTQAEEAFLTGVGKIKGHLVMLLDIKKVLQSHDIIRLLSDKNIEKGV